MISFSLKVLLSVLSEDTEIDIVDRNGEAYNGDMSPEELLENLSDNLLYSQVVKITPSNEFARWIEIMLDINNIDANDVSYPAYKRKYFGGKTK